MPERVSSLSLSLLARVRARAVSFSRARARSPRAYELIIEIVNYHLYRNLIAPRGCGCERRLDFGS